MSISSSAGDRKPLAVTRAKDAGATALPVTLSERSITCLALIRIVCRLVWLYCERVTSHHHPRLWLAAPAYLSGGLFQPAIPGRLHGVRAVSGGRLDGRTPGIDQSVVRTLHPLWSHTGDHFIHPTLCRPGLYRMDLDLRHDGAAWNRPDSHSSRPQARRRCLAGSAFAASSAALSPRALRELVGVA